MAPKTMKLLVWVLTGAAAGAVLAASVLVSQPQSQSQGGDAPAQSAAGDSAALAVLESVPRENAVVLAVKRAAPAVVNISTEAIVRRRPPNPFMGSPFSSDFFNFFMGPQQEKRQTLGSGFIFDSRGYILTNEHVVAQAVRVKVLLANAEEMDAVIVGSDRELDLAVLKVDWKGKPLPVVTAGRSDDLMIGEDVIAIGNPFGLSHTVTRGVLSAINRSIHVGERPYEHLLQIDAAINPGNSGGPLLNIRGELIGVNAAIYGGGEGIGFAIPVDEAKRIAEDLVLQDQATPAWLGVTGLQPLVPELRSLLGYQGENGLVVANVHDGSPAAKAGISRGDVLVKLDGEDIQSFSAFLRLLGRHKVGDKVVFAVFREGKTLDKAVSLAELSPDDAARLAWERFGLRVTPLSPEYRALSGAVAEAGMAVADLRYAGPAHAAGFRPGDVITAFNNHEISDDASFRNAVLKTLWHRSLMVRVFRGEHSYWVPLTAAR